MVYMETLYEIANEIFDEEMFSDRAFLDAYNDAEGDAAHDTLCDIIASMCSEALETMSKVARDNKELFTKVVNDHTVHEYEVEVHYEKYDVVRVRATDEEQAHKVAREKFETDHGKTGDRVIRVMACGTSAVDGEAIDSYADEEHATYWD